jgi:hypothetical protein
LKGSKPKTKNKICPIEMSRAQDENKISPIERSKAQDENSDSILNLKDKEV